ncbi:Nn.00g039400.m01.CDS01 [Neocucurbitaria sp. VM-36]
MRFLYFLFAILLVVVLSLPSIFAEEFCGTDSNITLINADSFDPQIAGANFLKGILKYPWPIIGSRRPTRYCYVNERARNALSCVVQEGFTVWAQEVGEKASEENGHSLAWLELFDYTDREAGRKPKYCHDSLGEWNPAVEPEALAIHLDEKTDATPMATVGYEPEDWNDAPGRHMMILPSIIGHVLGLVHEHVRYDRDEYVEYRCENVKGFGAAYLKALLDGFGLETATKELCENKLFAQRYGFVGTAYTKNDIYPRIPKILDDGEFDYHSIMLYPSNAYAGPKCQGSIDNLDACTMVALDKINGKVVSKSFIHTNMVPSEGDVAFIKQYYPWISSSSSPKQGSPAHAVPYQDAEIEDSSSVGPREVKESYVRVHRMEVSLGVITLHEL